MVRVNVVKKAGSSGFVCVELIGIVDRTRFVVDL